VLLSIQVTVSPDTYWVLFVARQQAVETDDLACTALQRIEVTARVRPVARALYEPRGILSARQN